MRRTIFAIGLALLLSIAFVIWRRFDRIDLALEPSFKAHTPSPPAKMKEGCDELSHLQAVIPSPAIHKPFKSSQPLDADEIAIYKIVLSRWAQNSAGPFNVADVTFPLDRDSLQGASNCECLQGVFIEDGSAVFRTYHPLTPDILPISSMRLVDVEKQSETVRSNDPEVGMRKGKNVHKAVNDAFAAGLFTVSEIAFDGKHQYALVRYVFWCGALCGSGSTLVFRKTGGEWKNTDRHCGGWVS